MKSAYKINEKYQKKNTFVINSGYDAQFQDQE